MKEVSILIPVLNEEHNISQLVAELQEATRQLTHYNWKLLFVDDGSADKTWEIIEGLGGQGLTVTGIRLTRNFGKEVALMAGIEACHSDAAIIMDADLQHPPKLIPELVMQWESGNFSVVEGIKGSRGRESKSYSLFSKLYYLAIGKLGGLQIKGSSDFKLLDRSVIQFLQSMPERNIFFRGLTAWSGFPTTQVPFDVEPRRTGKHRISMSSRLSLALNSIFSFSKTPLTWILNVSILFIASSFFLGMHALYLKFSGQAMPGFTTVIILQLFIGGAVLFGLGIIGSYLARIYDEVKARPRYVVLDKITN